jgi:hypothetical protein
MPDESTYIYYGFAAEVGTLDIITSRINVHHGFRRMMTDVPTTTWFYLHTHLKHALKVSDTLAARRVVDTTVGEVLEDTDTVTSGEYIVLYRLAPRRRITYKASPVPPMFTNSYLDINLVLVHPILASQFKYPDLTPPPPSTSSPPPSPPPPPPSPPPSPPPPPPPPPPVVLRRSSRLIERKKKAVP